MFNTFFNYLFMQIICNMLFSILFFSFFVLSITSLFLEIYFFILFFHLQYFFQLLILDVSFILTVVVVLFYNFFSSRFCVNFSHMQCIQFAYVNAKKSSIRHATRHTCCYENTRMLPAGDNISSQRRTGDPTMPVYEFNTKIHIQTHHAMPCHTMAYNHKIRVKCIYVRTLEYMHTNETKRNLIYCWLLTNNSILCIQPIPYPTHTYSRNIQGILPKHNTLSIKCE